MNTLIIGAGIAGLAAAWRLLEGGCESVTVLEREPLAFSHSSARNAAIFRPLEESAVVVELVASSERLLARLPQAPPLIRRCGLLLVAHNGAALEKQRSVAQQLAIPFESLDRAELCTRHAELTDGRAAHALWLPTGGVIDIHGLSEALRARIQQLGGRVETNAEVKRLVANQGRIRAVELIGDTVLDCDQVVVAAGAWASQLGETCGAPLSLVPHRRHLVLLAPDATGLPASRPVVWDVETGVYFRPESGGILACPGDHVPSEPGVPHVFPEQIERLATLLPKLCPSLGRYLLRRPWACLRTMSDDRHMVIGADPRVGGLFWLAGLAGHGMSAGLGAGELLSRCMLGGDLPEWSSALSVERLTLPFAGPPAQTADARLS